MANSSHRDPGASPPATLRTFPAAKHPPPMPSSPVLLPLIPVDADMSLALERTLLPAAIRAKMGDRDARDALYWAFEPKLMRFVRRIRVPYAPPGDHAVWERDDVIQETWLVFVALCDAWEPELPFGRYILANFPWRLRDTMLRGFARRILPPTMKVQPMTDTMAIYDHRAEGMTDDALIEALASSFESPFDEVIRIHILERRNLVETAERLGVSRRTITRYWHAIVTRLRADELAIATRWHG